MWAILALLLISVASAETRPRYGGTLRVEMRAAPSLLDPASPATGDDPGFAQIAPLVYDTLVRLDPAGRPVASLASSWCALYTGTACSPKTSQIW